jgi:hypothetical protein
MRRGRLLYLLGSVALFAAWFSQFHPRGGSFNTWSDGH